MSKPSPNDERNRTIREVRDAIVGRLRECAERVDLRFAQCGHLGENTGGAYRASIVHVQDICDGLLRFDLKRKGKP